MTDIEMLEREFRKFFPHADEVVCQWHEDQEQWIVTVDDEEWMCQVGSDDDRFEFFNIRFNVKYESLHDNAPPNPLNATMLIAFDFPADWLEEVTK